MLAHQALPDSSQLGPRRKICRLVDAVGRHSANMLGRASSLRENREDVLESLLELLSQVLAGKPLLLVPAYLAGDEHKASGGGDDAVGVSNGRCPTRREQNRHLPGRMNRFVLLPYGHC